MIEKNKSSELLQIYVDINPSSNIRKIIVEYPNQVFEFYKTLEIKGPSCLKNGHKVGHNNRNINIWIETNSIICGELETTPPKNK